MNRPIKDSAAQKAYDAQKNAQKTARRSLAAEDIVETPSQLHNRMQKTIKEKFSAEDIDKVKQIGASLKKYNAVYQASLRTTSESQINKNQEKQRTI